MKTVNDLTVWCVCIGDKYNTGYVYALKEMVSRNLTLPHTFKCITTHYLHGINTVNPFVPYQGFWCKMSLFAPTVATGPSIYLDLDVVITGNIDYLADYTDTFSAPPNWANSGHGGIQSSVMCWPGNWTFPYDEIRKDWPGTVDSNGYREMRGYKFWGDQEYLWCILGDNWEKIPNVGSYKYHVMSSGTIPEWMRICVFHGRPDPHEVSDECLSPYTLIQNYLTKSNTGNGSKQDSGVTA